LRIRLLNTVANYTYFYASLYCTIAARIEKGKIIKYRHSKKNKYKILADLPDTAEKLAKIVVYFAVGWIRNVAIPNFANVSDRKFYRVFSERNLCEISYREINVFTQLGSECMIKKQAGCLEAPNYLTKRL
jgi:hypothetical protein